MHAMASWQFGLILSLIVYVAICFGRIASYHGRNPWLWGVISVLSPVNLIVLGYWAITHRLPFGNT